MVNTFNESLAIDFKYIVIMFDVTDRVDCDVSRRNKKSNHSKSLYKDILLELQATRPIE